MNIKRILSKIKSFPYILNGYARPSYAQFGEDRILESLFIKYGIKSPSYLEIGTNHPVKGNNTYFFYTHGARGVLVEPDPYYHSLISRTRKGDVLVKQGVALHEEKEADFYIYPIEYTGWNTFSVEEVKIRQKQGINYSKKISVPLINVNGILEAYFDKSPDFLSIDVEGLDEEILRSYNFEKFAPRIICVEIIRFGDSDYSEMQSSIVDFILSKGYTLFANTHFNGIFIKND